MHDAIPSRILNGWLRLEEDLFHLQVLSYLPPQIPIYLTNSLKNLDFTGFLSSFILIFNVFSLVFSLMSENKGKFCF